MTEAERTSHAFVYVKGDAPVWVGLMGDWPTVVIDSVAETEDCDHLIEDLQRGLECVRGPKDD